MTVWHDTLGTFQQRVTIPTRGEAAITIEYPLLSMPIKNRTDWFCRRWRIWHGNLRLRLSVGMAFAITIGMASFATVRLVEIRQSVEQAAQARALAVSRTFSMVGAAAVLDNLFRIQEALGRYAQDSDIVSIRIIDPDSVIVAATNPQRIGQQLTDQTLVQAHETNAETISHGQTMGGLPTLLMVTPLLNEQDIAAWVRIEFSLAVMQEELAREARRLFILSVLLIDGGHDFGRSTWDQAHVRPVSRTCRKAEGDPAYPPSRLGTGAVRQ